MNGGPSHVDTFDYKPGLKENEGKSGRGGKFMPSPFAFSKHGECGMEISELFPHLSRHADDLCVIRSMWTDVPAHEEATKIMTTGDFRLPKPSIGAWVTYGLGSDNQNLPAFVAMNPGGFPSAGNVNWQSAFMPGAYQGTLVNNPSASVEKIIENIKSQHLSLAQDQLGNHWIWPIE